MPAVARKLLRTRIEEKIMRSKGLLMIGAMVALIAACSFAAGAQGSKSTAKPSDEAVRAEHAAAVLADIMEAPDQGIPEALLQKANGIAVIPHVVKGAFGIGG